MTKLFTSLLFLLSLNLYSQETDTNPIPYSMDNQHYGYVSYRWNVDETWEVVIAPRFEAAFSFSEGLARVQEFGKFGYINLNGDYVINPVYDLAEDFKKGIARVKKGFDWFYIDTQGRRKEPKVCDLKLENVEYYPYYELSKDGLTIFKIRLFR